MQRPLQLLYPLEMTRQPTSASNASTEPDGGVDSNAEPLSESALADGPAVRRSRRSAATQASDRIKACFLELESR